MDKNNNSNINNNNNNNNYNYNINDDDKVAIIGIGFRIPSGNDNKSNDNTIDLWNALYNGFDGVMETTSRCSEFAGLLKFEEIKSFDSLFFGINPAEASFIDPRAKLMLKCVWEALENAMIDPMDIRGSNTSVYAGYSIDDKNQTTISNLVSYCFDLDGESVSNDNECSSLNSIKFGYQSIKSGNSNISIVGGVNLLKDPKETKYQSSLKMLSKSGKCKTFDANADGYVRSEGCGVIVLKNYKQALADGNNMYCIINGTNSNEDDQNSLSISSDNIKQALRSTNGQIAESDIVYFETNGTSTATDDSLELKGISMALNTTTCNNQIPSTSSSNNQKLLIGSIKSNVGHSEAASGITSIIKCCLMFKNKCFAPNIHFDTPNPLIKFDEWNLKVVTEPIPFSLIIKGIDKPISMAINNFGVIGSNVCLILSEPPFEIKQQQQQQQQQQYKHQKQDEQRYLIPFSANTIKSLEKYLSSIKRDTTVNFNEFVKHQLNKSTKLVQRQVVLACDWDEFNSGMMVSKSANDSITSSIQESANKENPTVVFIYCGQGSQYVTMAKQLYESEPVFREMMDKWDRGFYKYYGMSPLENLRKMKDSDFKSLYGTIVPAVISMIQISLFELYKHWGVDPSFIIGHSVGEIPAAYCAGMIDMDTACYIGYNKTIEQCKTDGTGGLLAIGIGEIEYLEKYTSKYPTVEIACYNSQDSIVLGGDENLLKEISNELKNNGVLNRMINALSPYHTSSQIVVKDEILSLKFQSKPPIIPIFSTVTTNLFDQSKPTFNSQYVLDNIVKPVKFQQTIANLYKHIEKEQLSKDVVFIEISPNPTLIYYLKQMVPSKDNGYFRNASFSFYTSLSKKNTYDQIEFKQTISQLFCQGYNGINFKCQFDKLNYLNCDINSCCPLYQWDYSEPPTTPRAEISSNTTKESIQQSNDVGEIILNRISEFLSIDSQRINKELTLIGYGADSLIINLFKNWVDNRFKTSNFITIQQLQTNTIGSFIEIIKTALESSSSSSNEIKNQTIQERIEYWKNEMKLDESMIANDGNDGASQMEIKFSNVGDKRILLTGSTGFVGAYVLSHLIKLSSCSIVYCLIRNKSKSVNPIDEIISNLKYHQLYNELNQDHISKIAVVVGDLSLDRFGISSNDQYSLLSSTINLIINSGADIDLESNYQTCKLVNVNGLKECIKLSISSYPPIKIATFSTYFIFLNQKFPDDQKEFEEDTVLPSIENIDNLQKGYLQSKVVAEYLLKNASQSFNIPTMIIRLPSIFSNPHTGIGSKYDLPQLFLQSCYAVGHYPKLTNAKMCMISSITWTTINSMNLILNDKCWSGSNSVSKVYGVYGESQQNLCESISRLIESDDKHISFEDWKQMVIKSNHKSCIFLKTFHSFTFDSYKIDPRFTNSKTTRSLLQSMNNYGGINIDNDYTDLNSWKITDQMIINNINHTFKSQ